SCMCHCAVAFSLAAIALDLWMAGRPRPCPCPSLRRARVHGRMAEGAKLALVEILRAQPAPARRGEKSEQRAASLLRALPNIRPLAARPIIGRLPAVYSYRIDIKS